MSEKEKIIILKKRVHLFHLKIIWVHKDFELKII